MAGETPGADKSRERRRKLSWNDDRSTNKIYASGNASALGNKVSKKPVKVVKGKVVRADDKSTDKYYRAQDIKPTKQQIERNKLARTPKTGAPMKKTNGRDLAINDPSEINGVMQEVIERVASGPIVVYVKSSDSSLLRRSRTALEMLVTRGVITEEQYHDVRLSYSVSEKEQESINEKLGSAPIPREKQVINVDEVGELDIDKFLSGGVEEVVNTSPCEVKEVDTSNDVTSPVNEGTEDDDLGDLLNPKKEIEVMEGVGDVVNEITDTHIKTPTEAMEGVGDKPKPRRPGRKSGRGT